MRPHALTRPNRSRPEARDDRTRHRRARLGLLVAGALAVASLSACDPTRSTTTGSGKLWTSKAELAALPTSGSAWTRVLGVAKGSWGSPSLSSNEATHDTSTLAGAFVAARTGDQAMVAKTRAAIMGVTKVTSYRRALEASRNITAYVIAADLVDLPSSDEATFRSFISNLRTRKLEGHSGGTSILTTALYSPNNWGAMARAAIVAIDLYLGDDAQLAQIARTHRAWLGEDVSHQLRWSDTKWHASSDKAGINRRGAKILGRVADGVLPEDQRRSGEPTSGTAAEGIYPWEALQGALVTGVLLDRAGVVDINAGDQALKRAFTWLTTTNANPAEGDDTWQPWVMNRVAGTSFPTKAASTPGKNMAWSDWTHGPRS